MKTSGIMTKQGIPSFTEDEEDTGDVSNPGGGMSSSPDTSPDSGDDDKALSYVNCTRKQIVLLVASLCTFSYLQS